MMMGVFAELERDLISQRVKSGMANAKRKGKTLGRPTTTKDRLPKKFWEFYSNYNNKEINLTDYAKIVGVSRKTIYEYLKVAEK